MTDRYESHQLDAAELPDESAEAGLRSRFAASHTRNERGGVTAGVAVGVLGGVVLAGAGIAGSILGMFPHIGNQTEVDQATGTITKFVKLNEQTYAGAFIDTSSTTTVYKRVEGKFVPDFNVPGTYSKQTVSQDLEVKIGQKASTPDAQQAASDPDKYSQVKVTYNPKNNRTVVDVPESALTFTIVDHPENDSFGAVENGAFKIPGDVFKQVGGLVFSGLQGSRDGTSAGFTKTNMASNYDEAYKCMPLAWSTFTRDRFIEANKDQIISDLKTYKDIDIDPSKITVNLPEKIAVPENPYSAALKSLDSREDTKISSSDAKCQISPEAKAQAESMYGQDSGSDNS